MTKKLRELSLSTDFDGAPDEKDTYSKLAGVLWVWREGYMNDDLR